MTSFNSERGNPYPAAPGLLIIMYFSNASFLTFHNDYVIESDYGILIELIFDDIESFYISFYISRKKNDFFEFSNNGPMKFQKLTLKKNFKTQQASKSIKRIYP